MGVIKIEYLAIYVVETYLLNCCMFFGNHANECDSDYIIDSCMLYAYICIFACFLCLTVILLMITDVDQVHISMG